VLLNEHGDTFGFVPEQPLTFSDAGRPLSELTGTRQGQTLCGDGSPCVWRPAVGSFSQLNGQIASGSWYLYASDLAPGDVATITAVELELRTGL
jgi:hypothetical protein